MTDYFNSESTSRPGPDDEGFIRYAYRPFDTRWLYWEADSGLLDRPRPDYKPHVFQGNLWFSSVPRLQRDATETAFLTVANPYGVPPSDNFGSGEL